MVSGALSYLAGKCRFSNLQVWLPRRVAGYSARGGTLCGGLLLWGVMNFEIRYFDDCPNWRDADELVSRLVGELGVEAVVRRRLVKTPEEAERLSFVGSPTVVIDGVDPFLEPGAAVGLSCRVYRTESGLAGSPSEAQLRSAVEAAR